MKHDVFEQTATHQIVTQLLFSVFISVAEIEVGVAAPEGKTLDE